jgi:hypothetical protein
MISKLEGDIRELEAQVSTYRSALARIAFLATINSVSVHDRKQSPSVDADAVWQCNAE